MKGENGMENNNDKGSSVNHSVSINGNSSGVQIQQNVTNSTQLQIANEMFDYDRVLEILIEISNFQPMFNDTYGGEAGQVIDALNSAKEAVMNKEKPVKIKALLNVIKDVSLKVSSSLIATGIFGLLSKIGF